MEIVLLGFSGFSKTLSAVTQGIHSNSGLSTLSDQICLTGPRLVHSARGRHEIRHILLFQEVIGAVKAPASPAYAAVTSRLHNVATFL